MDHTYVDPEDEHTPDAAEEDESDDSDNEEDSTGLYGRRRYRYRATQSAEQIEENNDRTRRGNIAKVICTSKFLTCGVNSCSQVDCRVLFN